MQLDQDVQSVSDLLESFTQEAKAYRNPAHAGHPAAPGLELSLIS